MAGKVLHFATIVEILRVERGATNFGDIDFEKGDMLNITGDVSNKLIITGAPSRFAPDLRHTFGSLLIQDGASRTT